MIQTREILIIDLQVLFGIHPIVRSMRRHTLEEPCSVEVPNRFERVSIKETEKDLPRPAPRAGTL